MSDYKDLFAKNELKINEIKRRHFSNRKKHKTHQKQPIKKTNIEVLRTGKVYVNGSIIAKKKKIIKVEIEESKESITAKDSFKLKFEKFKELQNLQLNEKIKFAISKIEEFYNSMNGEVYISFSGGKDSLVLKHLVKSIYPNVRTIFVDTTNETPELLKYVKTFKDVETLKPKYTFKQIINKYGFPLISKEVAHKVYQIKTTKSAKLKNIRLNGDERGKSGMLSKKWQFLVNAPFNLTEKCCHHLKKAPLLKFEKQTELKSFVGITSGESMLRFTSAIKDGCNIFKNGKEKSRPLLIFTEKDIWDYIKLYKLNYCKLYDEGESRLGCQGCSFGLQFEPKDNNRFTRLESRRPKQFNALMNFKNNNITYREALKFSLDF